MAEREKYVQWLEGLDEKRETTPEHVIERVRADYSARLESVTERLREHTATLQEHATGLLNKLRDLEDLEQRIRDEHAEAEVRRDVGELSGGEWDAISKKAHAQLSKIQADQELIANDLNRIRELVQSRPTGAVEAQSEPPARVSASGDGVVELPRHSADFDELAFLKSVVGPTTPSSPVPPPTTVPKMEITKGAEIGGPAARKKTPTPAIGSESTPAAKVTPRDGPAQPVEKPLSKLVSGDHPLAIRSSGAVEQPKTLKCGECGTMNYASEWYCERCGAELAAI